MQPRRRRPSGSEAGHCSKQPRLSGYQPASLAAFPGIPEYSQSSPPRERATAEPECGHTWGVEQGTQGAKRGHTWGCRAWMHIGEHSVGVRGGSAECGCLWGTQRGRPCGGQSMGTWEGRVWAHMGRQSVGTWGESMGTRGVQCGHTWGVRVWVHMGSRVWCMLGAEHGRLWGSGVWMHVGGRVWVHVGAAERRHM